MQKDHRLALILKPHLGIAGTRNTGIAWSDPGSKYLLFLDQDDVIDARFLEELVAVLTDRKDAVAAYAIADYVDAAGFPLADGAFARFMRTRRVLHGRTLERLDPTTDVIWPELFPANHLYPPSALLARRSAVIDVGGFDAGYDVADDWDLLLRLSRRAPIVPWDHVRVGYRRHSLNASGDHSRNIRETRAVWANTYYDEPSRRELHGWWRAMQRDAASRKRAHAAHQLGERAVVRALSGLADAAAHTLLLAPPRFWRTPRRLMPPDLRTARVGSIIRAPEHEPPRV
jgi:GT2 family glycosyltransferase